ncbi:uncharacterized protein [Lolium perenne]|uniref:uncharacterized protein n=1 Tax=Lolium perenne TaxID=4522 RepID=UPI0021F57A03|nr:cysteine-rich repeat secretory protein 38-like [Lolium perenne]
MALPAAISCLLLSLLVAVMPLPGAGEERVRVGSVLIKCYDPEPAALTNATEFRARLLPLLAKLPSAAAPTGFASLNSTGRAFVRGMCFGQATVPSSDCLHCLSLAVRNLTSGSGSGSGCGAATRRAGIWTERCYVAYADTNASSNAEYAFRSRVLLTGNDAAPDAPTFYSYYLHAWLLANLAQPAALSAAANISAPRMTATAHAATPADDAVRSAVHVLAQCARDRTAAECATCLQDSARALDWDLDADRRDGGVAAAVVGFNCYLRFNVSTAVKTYPDQVFQLPLLPLYITIGILAVLVLVLIAVCLLSRA